MLPELLAPAPNRAQWRVPSVLRSKTLPQGGFADRGCQILQGSQKYSVFLGVVTRTGFEPMLKA